MYAVKFDTKLDWLQLGCLILWCTTGSPGEDYHKQTLPENDPIAITDT